MGGDARGFISAHTCRRLWAGNRYGKQLACHVEDMSSTGQACRCTAGIRLTNGLLPYARGRGDYLTVGGCGYSQPGASGLGATPEDTPPATCKDVQIMRIPNNECRRRAGAAAVARLATTGSDLRPHLVPVTFAFTGDQIVIAIDSKPKTTTRLRRLSNIDENPRVCLLWDEYDDDWSQLWWVRADATAQVETSGPSWSAAVEALSAKYPQYALDAPRGPVIRIAVSRWTGWAAAPGHFPGPGRPGGFPR